ncbi:MAG: FtsX-like permease family protein, partial [Gemmatimonadales bacterium]
LMFFGTMSAVVAWRVEHIDLGYDTRNLLQASVELPGMRYVDATARDRFFQEAFTGLASRPEIDGVVLRAPLADISREESAYEIAGGTPAGLRPHAFILAVLGQLAPLGIGLREGRFFDSRDGGTSEGTVILSASLAARIWPGVSPIGRQVRLAGRGERSWRTVVGVVDDVLLGNPLSRNRSPLAMYIPLGQADLTGADVVFRYRSDLPAGRAAFHQALNRLDPLLIPSTLTSFEEMLGKTTLIARSVTRLFAACFGFALLLALTGVYGLMARSIGRRTRELGVRRALGASDRVILGMLLGQGARQLGAGALVALPLTLAVAWGFSRYFPIAFTVAAGAAILVSLTIVVVVVAATWLPTRRAVAIQPRDALWRD